MASKKKYSTVKKKHFWVKIWQSKAYNLIEIGYHYITHNNIAVAKKFEKYRVKSN